MWPILLGSWDCSGPWRSCCDLDSRTSDWSERRPKVLLRSIWFYLFECNNSLVYVNIFRPLFSCKMKIPLKWSEWRSFLMKWSEWTNCFFLYARLRIGLWQKLLLITVASLQVSCISPFTKTTMAFHLLFNATVCKFLISILTPLQKQTITFQLFNIQCNKK